MPIVPLSSLNVEDAFPQQTETETFDENLALLRGKDEKYSVEATDPSYNNMAVGSYKEFVKSVEFNDRAKSLFFPFAKGPALDYIGNTYHLTPRLVIVVEDLNATPPVEQVNEEDEDYMARIMLAGDTYSTAGSKPGYIYHAKSASGDVTDVAPVSPSPAVVDVIILSRIGDGTPDAALLTTVTNALTDDVRPLTDQVNVIAATILPYSINATIDVYRGFDQATILANAQAAIDLWVEEQRALGRDITELGIRDEIKTEGAHNVVLNNTGGAITADMPVTKYQASYCTGITLAIGATID